MEKALQMELIRKPRKSTKTVQVEFMRCLRYYYGHNSAFQHIFPPTGGVIGCGQLSSIKHGSCTIESCANKSEEIAEKSNGNCMHEGSYAFGSIVRYKCEKYYELQGPEFRTCDQNGEWTGDIPFCEPSGFFLHHYP